MREIMELVNRYGYLKYKAAQFYEVFDFGESTEMEANEVYNEIETALAAKFEAIHDNAVKTALELAVKELKKRDDYEGSGEYTEILDLINSPELKYNGNE